jgi:hypothetical protein
MNIHIISSRAHRIAVLENMVETFAAENTGVILSLLHGEQYRQTQRNILVARAAIGELKQTGAVSDGPVETEEL